MKKRYWLLVPLTIAIIYLFLPQYAKKALVFINPGIEDYKIFQNREIKADNPKEWDYHYNYNQAKLT